MKLPLLFVSRGLRISSSTLLQSLLAGEVKGHIFKESDPLNSSTVVLSSVADYVERAFHTGLWTKEAYHNAKSFLHFYSPLVHGVRRSDVKYDVRYTDWCKHLASIGLLSEEPISVYVGVTFRDGYNGPQVGAGLDLCDVYVILNSSHFEHLFSTFNVRDAHLARSKNSDTRSIRGNKGHKIEVTCFLSGLLYR